MPYIIVLGCNEEHSFFKNQVSINGQVTIEGRIFEVVGMIAGAIPACRASKLRPVEALRYE